MALEKLFPKTIFTKQYIEKYGQRKAITKQLEVVAGELLEVQDACSQENYDKALEECVDALQAVHTAMYMIPGYNSEKVSNIILMVQLKNQKRGYYEQGID